MGTWRGKAATRKRCLPTRTHAARDLPRLFLPMPAFLPLRVIHTHICTHTPFRKEGRKRRKDRRRTGQDRDLDRDWDRQADHGTLHGKCAAMPCSCISFPMPSTCLPKPVFLSSLLLLHNFLFPLYPLPPSTISCIFPFALPHTPFTLPPAPSFATPTCTDAHPFALLLRIPTFPTTTCSRAACRHRAYAAAFSFAFLLHHHCRTRLYLYLHACTTPPTLPTIFCLAAFLPCHTLPTFSHLPSTFMLHVAATGVHHTRGSRTLPPPPFIYWFIVVVILVPGPGWTVLPHGRSYSHTFALAWFGVWVVLGILHGSFYAFCAFRWFVQLPCTPGLFPFLHYSFLSLTCDACGDEPPDGLLVEDCIGNSVLLC